MEYINPLFNDTRIEKTKKTIQKKTNNLNRSTRIDKNHNIKFPISKVTQMKLKSHCKQAGRIYQMQGMPQISQTKFNTLLLRFGLKHEEIIFWGHQYKDSKVYMHTNVLETEYLEIGGPHGLAIRKSLSERKVVYHIILSVLNWLEGEGNIEKII